MHATALFASTIAGAIFLTIFSGGCRSSERAAAPTCPPGDILSGAPPPKGTEVYCHKVVDGKTVKDGPFIVYADGGGKLIEGKYRNGVQEGRWTTWYENGQRSATDDFHLGLQDGLHTSWYANGQKAIEGTYRAGKREGVWTRWDPSGLTGTHQTYRNDLIVK